VTSASLDLLPDLEAQPLDGLPMGKSDDPDPTVTKADLDPVLNVPITVTAILGHTELPISDVLKLAPGSIIELDRAVGEPIDIYINDRIVARGEVVLVDERLGVTLSEVISH
jgi:flagellar motor switch protein FliN/FliY